jgi:hypothetical protein
MSLVTGWTAQPTSCGLIRRRSYVAGRSGNARESSSADLVGRTCVSISPLNVCPTVPTTVSARGYNRPQTTPRQPSRKRKTPRYIIDLPRAIVMPKGLWPQGSGRESPHSASYNPLFSLAFNLDIPSHHMPLSTNLGTLSLWSLFLMTMVCTTMGYPSKSLSRRIHLAIR